MPGEDQRQGSKARGRSDEDLRNVRSADSGSDSKIRSRGEPKQSRPPAERVIKPRGQVAEGKGASGAPEGGQIDGRQGDQEGMRR